MSRPLRVLYPGAWYHVMNRGKRRDNIFRDDKDRSRFLDLVKELRGLFQCRVASFSLIPDHYHLLMQTLEPNLPVCMKHIDGVYTQFFNKKYGCDGQLFRGRYKALLVDCDGYLIDVVKYIHLNPKKAGLEKKLGEYRWTSHQGYLSNAKKWDWLAVDDVFRMLSRDPAGQRRAYQEFMRNAERKEVTDFYANKKLSPVLGGSTFVQWVKDSFSNAIHREGVTNVQGLRRSLDEVLSAVTGAFGISREAILVPKWSVSNEARDAALTLARRYTGLPSTSLARSFGVGWGSTVCAAANRVNGRVRNDSAFRGRLEAAEDRLKKGIL